MMGLEIKSLEELILESKDGEWGESIEKTDHILCNVIRGTDFKSINNAKPNFPQRFIKGHLAERKALKPFID